MPPLGKGGNAIHNVAAAADFQDVAPERVGALFGDDYWRFGLVFRPWRSATRSPVAASRLEAVVAAAASVGVLIISFEIVVVPTVFVLFVVLLVRGCCGVAGAAVSGSVGGVVVFELFFCVSEVKRWRS